MTGTIRQYIELSKKLENIEDSSESDQIHNKLEELYFELEDEDINFLERKGYI